LNPESLAATRWKPIRQAHEQIAKAQNAQAKSQARLQELRAQIGPAELRDRAALGQALVDGKAEPASEAAKLKAELEQEERNAEALALAVQSAHGQVAELVAANRHGWRKETLRELSRKLARYKDVITELDDGKCQDCTREYERGKSRERRASSTAVKTRDSRTWQRARALAKQRDGSRCVRCGASERLEVHHVVPIEQGGERFMLSNLVTLCRRCHEDEEHEAKARFLDTRPPTHLPDLREKHSAGIPSPSKFSPEFAD
jgi:5-methylcytosine-specific restriction endonuclease McrA